MAIKPTINKPEFATAATGSDISEPTARKTTGFVAPGGLPEKPNRQELNFLLKSITEWTAYLESITDENLSFLNSTNDRFKEADDVALGLTSGYITRKNGAEWQASTNENANEVVINDFDKAIFIGQQGKIFRSSVTSNTIITLTNADNSNPRYDLIYLDTETGLISFETGTPAAIPTKPAIPIGREGLCYVLRRPSQNIPKNKDIEDIRQRSEHNATHVGIYRTNFSIHTPETTNTNWHFDKILRKQSLEFGTEFDSFKENDIQVLRNELMSIPVDSPDIQWSAGWTFTTDLKGRYGELRSTSVDGSSFTWKFFGTGFGLVHRPDNVTHAHVSTRIRKIGGNYDAPKRTGLYNHGSTGFKEMTLFYQGLKQDWYEVELTVDYTETTYHIESFYTEVRCCIKLLPEFNLLEGNVTGVNDIPFGNILYEGSLSGGNLPHANSSFYNALFMASPTGTTTPKIRFRFYGKAVWFISRCVSLSSPTIVFKIDGVQTNVKVTSYNYQTPTNPEVGVNPIMHLISDETLTDGMHEVEISISSAGTVQGLEFSGYAYYSDDHRSTTSRDLICGKETEIISVLDSKFSFVGYPVSQGSIDQMFGANAYSSTPGDEITITTPNVSEKPLRAIYAVINVEDGIGNSNRTRVNLGGVNDNVIYIQHSMSNRDWGQQIVFLYDSFLLGQSLDNLTLRFSHDTGNSYINGVIFEYGDIIENDCAWLTPKNILYNETFANDAHNVSTMHYLSAQGIKTDRREGNKHNVFMAVNSSGVGQLSSASFGCFCHPSRFESGPTHWFGTLGPNVASMESIERTTGWITMLNYFPNILRQAISVGSVDNFMTAKFKEVI